VPLPPDHGDRAGILSRRQFLAIAGGTAALAMSRGQLIRQARRAAKNFIADAAADAPDISLTVERDVDLLALEFQFFGFTLQSGQPPAIVPTTNNNTIVVTFPPQTIGEAVYPYSGSGPFAVDPPPILSDLGAPSRLAFTLNPQQRIPLPTMTAADLLSWDSWFLKVAPAAESDNVSRREDPNPIRAINPDETQIECPYALYLSPTDLAGFHHRLQPLTIDDTGFGGAVTDCWTTALTAADQRIVAAYARDYPGSGVADATQEMVIDYQAHIK
jgi:hypothetical protein